MHFAGEDGGAGVGRHLSGREKDEEIKLQIAFLEQTGLKSPPSPPLLMADDIFSMQICIMERYVLCVISTAGRLECVITLFKKGATVYQAIIFPHPILYSSVFMMVNHGQNISVLGDEEYIHSSIIAIKLHLLSWDPAWQRGAGRRSL